MQRLGLLSGAVLALVLLPMSAAATVLVSDDIGYPDGSLVGNGSWANHSGTAGDMLVESEAVVVQHGVPSEDASLPFTPTGSGNIYYGIDFSVDDLGAPYSAGGDYEYFAHFRTGFDFSARLDIVPPTGSGDYSVGIASDESTADIVWPTDLTYGVVYRAIVRYDQDGNIAELWIDAAAETDPSIVGEDRADPGDVPDSFALRQSDSSENETVRVDNIVVGTTFDDVLCLRPVAIINGPNEICGGETALLEGPAGNYQYIWFGPRGSFQDRPFIEPAVAGTYTLTIIDKDTGCRSLPFDFELIVNPLPFCFITGESSICPGDSTELCGPEGDFQYTWSGPGGLVATTRCIVAKVAGTYTLTTETQSRCTNTCSFDLEVGPVAIINGPNEICGGETARLEGPAGNYRYIWFGPRGSFQDRSFIEPAVAGTYSLKIVDKETGCVSLPFLFDLTINPLPFCSITGPEEICAGETAELCGPEGNIQYTWSGPGGFSSNTRCISVSEPGTYTLVTETQSRCTNTCSHELALKPSPACDIAGPAASVFGQIHSYSTSATGVSYQWSVANSAIVGSSTGSSVDIWFNDAGTNTVTLTTTDDVTGCQSTCDFEVEVANPETCADGDPVVLEFEYTGDDCSASSHSQGGAASCFDFQPLTQPVQIFYAGSDPNISVSPAGPTVSFGDRVTVTTTAASLGESINLLVITAPGPQGLQTPVEQSITIHTSCSVPINVGDQFGSLVLRSMQTNGAPAVAPLVTDEFQAPAALQFALHSSYPNPTNGRTTIRFGLTHNGPVRVTVHDAQGRLVATPADGVMAAGEQSITWDGRASNGRKLPTGIYLVRLSAPQGVRFGKIMMLK